MALGFNDNIDAPQFTLPKESEADTSQGLAHAFIISAEKNLTSMAQLDGVDTRDGWVLNSQGMTEYRVPVFLPETWLSLSLHSPRLKRCLDAIARSSVGLGVTAHLPMDATGKGRNKSKAAKRDYEALKFLLNHPNPKIPLAEVLYRAEFDREACGSAWLEILEKGNAAKGSIYGINHVPAAGVRIHASGDKFVRVSHSKRSQTLTEQRVYYRRFGDLLDSHRYLDSATGTFYAEWPATLPEERMATAILQVSQYSPVDEFYGQPTAVSALTAVASNHFIGLWNLNFLHNNAHVPLAVVVENGNLSKDSKEYIEAFLKREARGLRNTGRVLILEPDMRSGLQATQIKIRLEPLKLGVQEDASFLKLHHSNNEQIREAFGLAGIFLGADGSAQSRAAASVRQTSQEQVIEPQTLVWEYVLNYHIASRIGSGLAQIRIKRPLNLDTGQLANVVNRLKDGLSVNDLRHLANVLLQLPDDLPDMTTEFANYPLAELKVLAKEMLSQRGELELSQEEFEQQLELAGLAEELEESEE